VKICTGWPDLTSQQDMQEVTFVSMSGDKCHILHYAHYLHIMSTVHKTRCVDVPVTGKIDAAPKETYRE